MIHVCSFSMQHTQKALTHLLLKVDKQKDR